MGDVKTVDVVCRGLVVKSSLHSLLKWGGIGSSNHHLVALNGGNMTCHNVSWSITSLGDGGTFVQVISLLLLSL